MRQLAVYCDLCSESLFFFPPALASVIIICLRLQPQNPPMFSCSNVPVGSLMDAQAAASFTWFKGALFLQKSMDALYVAHYQQISLLMSHRRQTLLKDVIKLLRPRGVKSVGLMDSSPIENPLVVKLSR